MTPTIALTVVARWLREHVVLEPGAPVDYLRALAERVAAGEPRVGRGRPLGIPQPASRRKLPTTAGLWTVLGKHARDRRLCRARCEGCRRVFSVWRSSIYRTEDRGSDGGCTTCRGNPRGRPARPEAA